MAGVAVGRATAGGAGAAAGVEAGIGAGGAGATRETRGFFQQICLNKNINFLIDTILQVEFQDIFSIHFSL